MGRREPWVRDGWWRRGGRVCGLREGVPIRSAVVMITISVLISVLAFIATVALWIERSAGSEAAFSANAAEVLTMDSSQQALAERLMDEAIDAVPLLALVRGAGEQATVALLDSGAFDEAMNRVIVEAHRHVVSGADGPFTADLTDVRDVLVAPIARISPDLADRIPVEVFENVVILDSGALPILGTLARGLPAIVIFSAAGAVFLAVALVMLADRRSVAMIAVGLAVAFAGLGVTIWGSVGGSVAAERIDDDLTRTLVVNGYAVINPWLRSAGLVLAIGGIVFAAGGAIAAAARRGTVRAS